ncbi:MAG: peptide ABC transporter substrate-binding protein [Chloroflexi bacterium]|nr:peptide ABC transporter substrate-binding protein [Chloroflexota bacterium]
MNIFARRLLLLCPLLMLALWLAGCAATQAKTAEPDAQEILAHDQKIVLIIPEEPTTLNQYLAVAPIVRQVADATTAKLTTVDENGEFVPVLAAELPTLENGGVSKDALTVTWKLRAGLKWSDGQPLTSDDVKFTWEAVSNPDSGAVLAVAFDLIDTITTPDPLTAIVRYKQVNQAYLQQFMYGVLPRHAAGLANNMLNWSWNHKPVSAGPFVVSAWNMGESIVMDRNPYYYLKGQPYLGHLIFQIVPDPAVQISMMAKDEAQVQLWPGETKQVYDEHTANVAALQEIPGPWNMALHFNLSRPLDDNPGPLPVHPILGDLRVRQALAYAIDYDTISNTVNPGTIPATSPFAYGWYKCDLPRLYRYDPDKAKQLLPAAGWIAGPNGMRIAEKAKYVEDGAPLLLQIEGYTKFQPLQDLEQALAEQFKAVGIETKIQNDESPVMFGSYADGSPRMTGNFDILVYDSTLPIDPQSAVAAAYHSSAIPSADNPAGANYSRWINAAADAAIERAGRTVDIQQRQAAYCELAQLITTDLPELHLYRFTEGYGASNRLYGYQVNMWGSLTWDVQNWQLKPADQ